jgi:large subunit ribosomal protein L17
MLSNMASSLIGHKRIFTTTAKAKALRKYVEPLITKSKEDTTHSRRVVFSVLQDKHAVTELFKEVSQKIGNRPGGYTRIIKTGNRLGDNASMCFIELVDYNENMLKSAVKKTSRTRRSRKKSAAATVAAKTQEKDVAASAATEEPTQVEEPTVREETVEEPATATTASDEELPAEPAEEDTEAKT